MTHTFAMTTRLRCLLIFATLAFALGAQGDRVFAREADETHELERLPAGQSTFEFKDWAGPALKVWSYVPEGVDPATAPILIVMHGMNRDADRYLEQWRSIAQAKGFVAVAPEFSRSQFRGSHEYNLGHVTRRGRTDLRDRSQWSFAAIEPLFDEIVSRIGGRQTTYTLYGHSAGSQYVHRFFMTQRNTRASRYIIANAGWYTLPTFALAYPHGMNGLDLQTDDLKAALASDVVVLLGEEDADPGHESLNRSDEAMRQGEHRLARGKFFFDFGREMARRENWPFNWTLRTVPGVEHDNGGMAQAAGELVDPGHVADGSQDQR